MAFKKSEVAIKCIVKNVKAIFAGYANKNQIQQIPTFILIKGIVQENFLKASKKKMNQDKDNINKII